MKKVTYLHFLIYFPLATLLVACGASNRGYTAFQVKGSDTEVNLALSLAETFMEQDSLVSVAVTGGGSGTGIAALINGRTDIANSSRPMKAKEIELAQARGITPYVIPFAMDGLALIVHETNPIDSISLEQISAIFRGEMTNWQGIGGTDQEITLYGRQNNSGTYVFFRDEFLKADYAPHAKQMNGNAQIVESVKKDKASIGYVGLGYVLQKDGRVRPGLKVLRVCSTLYAQAISPLIITNITSGAYPIIRPLYQFTNGKPSGKVLTFIQFELSAAGQAIIEREGYYPLAADLMEENKQRGLVGK